MDDINAEIFGLQNLGKHFRQGDVVVNQEQQRWVVLALATTREYGLSFHYVGCSNLGSRTLRSQRPLRF
jgi:hypothetical protein